MGRSGWNAEMQIRMEELEEMEAAGAGSTRTAASSNASVGGDIRGQHTQQQQQPSPIPSTASTPTTRISQVAPFQVRRRRWRKLPRRPYDG